LTINGDRGNGVTSRGRRDAATSPDGPASAPAAAPAGGRRFGEEGGLLTYGGYLRLDELLSQQVPQADPPAHDELLFITVHQVYELWFRQALYELEAARDAMMTDETWRARHLLRRVHVIERLLIAQVDILETMTPQDFLEFRAVLAPASGFQSVQYRELEFLSGCKDHAFPARFRAISAAQRDRLARRLTEPSLWDAYLRLLASRGLPVGDDQQILESLRVIAGDRGAHDEEWQLAEDLLTHDELAGLWRARHVAMVERQIGTKSGTGGSTGAPYLRKRVPLRYYPLLWELRDHL
jgi:tryptophan 2,3-dioxygenase